MHNVLRDNPPAWDQDVWLAYLQSCPTSVYHVAESAHVVGGEAVKVYGM